MSDMNQRKCTYSKCLQPQQSSRFYQIEEGKNAGGQDWSSLAGSVLCDTCYCRFYKRGTLEKANNKPLTGSARRCTSDHCDSPTDSSRFYQIEEGRTSGGQDWSSVAGSVLCKACYKRFFKRGTLERTVKMPLTSSAGRCTYDHCDRPTDGSRCYQIEEGKTAGGQDWSSIAGSVLCQACYERFRKKGTLEKQIQCKPLTGSARRCTYDHCDRPTDSSHFYQIEEGRTSGGKDWSSLVGSVLCHACFDRFRRRGTLEKCFQGQPLISSVRRCTNDNCDRPTHSKCFYQVEEGKTTGGQDWSSVAGSVLCKTCYKRFLKRGTLERTVNMQLTGSARRCTYDHCDSPTDSSRFYQIEEGRTSGGQDWSSVAGSVLCRTCYERFRKKGTLEKQIQCKPLTSGAGRCTNDNCDSPTDSRCFYHIEEGKTAGGRDWSSVAGSVLCQACYNRFYSRGTLERGNNKPLTGSARRCTSDHCDSPHDSSHFYHIEEGKTTGGQDWSSIAGSVLCVACYCRFKDRGTLERTAKKPLTGSARRCTNDNCDSPTDSSRFYQIEEGKTAGGRDWSSVAGSVLCKTCYERFKNRGTLEPSAAHVRKRQKTASHRKADKSSSSSSAPQTSCTTHHEEEQEEEEEKAPDTGECMACPSDSRSMCIVPCGHFGLCATCGDEGVFAGKKRPRCPICRAEMCEPYVMERWLWEELGGTSYET